MTEEHSGEAAFGRHLKMGIKYLQRKNKHLNLMQTFISILRGINVSGQKKILMTELKGLYEKLGYKDIETYIQSGNVIFRSPRKENDQVVARKITQVIFDHHKFEVPVLVRTLEEMKKILTVNPFLREAEINIEKLHITFLSETPGQSDMESIKRHDYPPDKFILIGKEVFLYCPVSYGETKLSNKFFENKLKVSATTRNWKTVNKLYEIAALK